MISVYYQLYNDGVAAGEPIEKTFATNVERFQWERDNSKHPFINYAETPMKNENISTAIHAQIIAELGVKPTIDAAAEVKRRVRGLADYLHGANGKCYVLGISGGVDSTVAGRLTQLAVELCRSEGYQAHFDAIKLPYGEQIDAADAQLAIEFIKPDNVMEMNIARASEAMLFELSYEVKFRDVYHEDFVMGNIKARQRMIAQYAVAGAQGGLVVGTDHAAEALPGFFTKGGDGLADIMPLAGLTKDQVRELAAFLGAPDLLVNKPAAAGLESLNPTKTDEEALGVSYDDINNFLKGKQLSPEIESKLIELYMKSAHKRALPVSLAENQWPG